MTGERGRCRLFHGLLALCVLAVAACGGSDSQAPVDQGEPVVAGCQQGTLGTALYRVCFPQSWNGDLVVYAHGYVAAGEPLALPDDNLGGQSISQVVNALGYGYATTSYSANGLVADVAVDDVSHLVEEVRRRFRPDPAHAFIFGVSEGGLVATLATERRPDLFQGGVAACGPIGDFVSQTDYFGDFRVLFDYFFPGVIPGDPIQVPDSVRSQWDGKYAPAVASAVAANPGAAQQLLAVSGAPTDPANAGVTATEVLWYDIFALPDAQMRLGGEPYDNVGRVYQGSLDDGALNAGVIRVAADAGARAGLSRFETSGSLTVPLSLLHTIGDPIVPVQQLRDYAGKVSVAGATAELDTTVVSRYGHCAFQESELLGAFSRMVGRAAAASGVS